MKRSNKLSNQYISEVKKNLRCSYKTKKKFLETLTPEIYNFELANPNATYDDYINEFNGPKTTAEEYMKELSKKEIRAYRTPRICAIIAIVIIAFAFLLVLFISQIDAGSGHTAESPAIEVSNSEAIYTYK
jgi:hypothetical protein